MMKKMVVLLVACLMLFGVTGCALFIPKAVMTQAVSMLKQVDAEGGATIKNPRIGFLWIAGGLLIDVSGFEAKGTARADSNVVE